MKLVYAETPATMGQDHSVDDSFLPEGVTHIISEYDPAQPITSEKNQKFVADIKDADIIINSYVDFQEELLDAMDHCKVISSSPPATTPPTSSTPPRRASPWFPSVTTARRRRPRTLLLP